MLVRRPLHAFLGLSLAAFAAIVASGGGCAGAASDTTSVGGTTTTSGGGGAGGEIFTPTTSGAGGGSEFEECAKATAAATYVPVNMFITIDKSGSMTENGKWDAAKAAFLAFFEDPAADGLRVALRFWPDQTCNEQTCSVDECSKPQVDIGPLSDPAHEQALIDLFNSKVPSGTTPMYAALGGATKWAVTTAKAAMSAEKTAVVLVTDGEPNGCEQDIQKIAFQASKAYTAAGVLTFAVGLAGSNESQINILANLGHTQKGFFIGNGNAESDLLAALKQIQKTAVACEFAMPEPMGGDPIDPGLVNVTWTSTGGKVTALGKVDEEKACGANGGWFYDDALNPTTITLCPQTCETVQADDEPKVEIVLGCETKPA